MTNTTINVASEDQPTNTAANAAADAADQAEVVSDAAVEIARIEADRDVAIAAINAETREKEIEAENNDNDDKENDAWIESFLSMMTQMRETLTTLETKISSIQQTLMQPPQSQLNESVSVDPTLEFRAAQEAPRKRPARRWI